MTGLPETAARRLADAGLDPQEVADLIARALGEDLRGGAYAGVDVTTAATVAEGVMASADLVPRATGVVAGLGVAAAVFEAVAAGRGHRVTVEPMASDGDRVEPGRSLLRVSGHVSDILTAERTALNLLGLLSGTATATRAWVDALAGTGAVVRDTRKTVPGMRSLQKYAVRCGGGANHRMSLSDAALVKDNHVVAAGGVAAAFRAVRERFPGVPVEVECDDLDQVREAVVAGADLVLLDNMSPQQLRAAVAIARPAGVRLEASGGLSLDRAREVGGSGVDYVAVGALTHSARTLDIGLDLGPVSTGRET